MAGECEHIFGGRAVVALPASRTKRVCGAAITACAAESPAARVFRPFCCRATTGRSARPPACPAAHTPPVGRGGRTPALQREPAREIRRQVHRPHICSAQTTPPHQRSIDSHWVAPRALIPRSHPFFTRTHGAHPLPPPSPSDVAQASCLTAMASAPPSLAWVARRHVRQAPPHLADSSNPTSSGRTLWSWGIRARWRPCRRRLGS